MDTKKSIPLFFLFFASIILVAPSVMAYKNSDVLIGTYVYTWYNPDESVSWEYPKITDKPVQGFYNSCDVSVIQTQINQIVSARIDFVCLNWLGLNTFSDNVTGQWYAVAKSNSTSLKLSIMVEPFNETESGYNYTEIYERAYELFSEYEAQSLMYEGKPVIFFYNGEYLTGSEGAFSLPLDSRFTVLTIGHRNYVDVWYDDIRNYIPDSIPHGESISVLPRFDDYWQYALGLRDHTHTVDRDLTEGLYKTQWERAIKYANRNAIRWVFIATWNEYPERTAIEPHYDNTAKDTDPYLLLNETAKYTAMLHGIEPQTEGVWYQNPYLFGVIILGIALGVALLWKH